MRSMLLVYEALYFVSYLSPLLPMALQFFHSQLAPQRLNDFHSAVAESFWVFFFSQSKNWKKTPTQLTATPPSLTWIALSFSADPMSSLEYLTHSSYFSLFSWHFNISCRDIVMEPNAHCTTYVNAFEKWSRHRSLGFFFFTEYDGGLQVCFNGKKLHIHLCLILSRFLELTTLSHISQADCNHTNQFTINQLRFCISFAYWKKRLHLPQYHLCLSSLRLVSSSWWRPKHARVTLCYSSVVGSPVGTVWEYCL